MAADITADNICSQINSRIDGATVRPTQTARRRTHPKQGNRQKHQGRVASRNAKQRTPRVPQNPWTETEDGEDSRLNREQAPITAHDADDDATTLQEHAHNNEDQYL